MLDLNAFFTEDYQKSFLDKFKNESDQEDLNFDAKRALQWTSRHQFNEPLRPLDGWFCIRKIGKFPIMFYIKIQYGIDENLEPTSETDMYLVGISLCGNKATKENKEKMWFANEEINGFVFEKPKFSRAFVDLEKAKEYSNSMLIKIYNLTKGHLDPAEDLV